MQIVDNLNKPNYAGWAQMNLWPLDCAIELIAASLVKEFMEDEGLKFYEEFNNSKKFVQRTVNIGIFNKELDCQFYKWKTDSPDEPNTSYINTFVGKDAFLRFVKDRGLPVHEDLWRSVRPKGSERKLRPEQEAKLICQGIAIALWDSNPDMTIAEMIKQEVLLEKGGGNCYIEDTIRGWVSEVDPRPSEKKTGPKPKK